MKTRLRRLMTLCLCLVLLGTSAAFPQKLLAESPSASDIMNAVFDTPYRHTLQSDYASIHRSTNGRTPCGKTTYWTRKSP